MHNERAETLLSKLIPLRHYAIARDRSVGEVAQELKKDYSTLLRSTKKLVDSGLLELSRLERTSKKGSARGKEKRYYKVTLPGLETALSTGDFFVKNIRVIAKAHSDKSLVFAKWDKFVQNGCEDALMLNLQDTLIHEARRHLTAVIVGLHPKQSSSWEAFDMDILGLYYYLKPIDYVKEVLGNKALKQMNIWKVVENDYELKQFTENFLHRQEMDCSTALKSLSEWREFLKTLEKKE